MNNKERIKEMRKMEWKKGLFFAVVNKSDIEEILHKIRSSDLRFYGILVTGVNPVLQMIQYFKSFWSSDVRERERWGFRSCV